MDIQIAWRNLWRNPRRTAIILTAVVIGICSMVVLSALMRGMTEGMVENAVDNLVGHIRIQDPGYKIDPSIVNRIARPEKVLEKIKPQLPKGSRIVTRIKVDGLLSTSREHLGVMIVGIVPGDEKNVSFISRSVTNGRMIEEGEANGVLIGRAMADRIGAEVGRKIVLMSQNSEFENVSKAYRVRGIYRTELASTEKLFAFVPLSVLQDMLGVEKGVTEIAISIENEDRIAAHDFNTIVSALNDHLVEEGLSVQSWREVLPAMSAYLEMFNGYMLIWFVVVFVAMGFGLVNTMLMAVYERMREFGLQRAIGMRSSRILRMVMVETFLLLVIGGVIANGCAFLILTIMSSGIDLSIFAQGAEMWGMSRIIIPAVAAWDVYAANGVVLVLGLLVGIYPARKAARFTPVETMRHL